MASNNINLKLASGYSIPQVGLGTWESKKGEVKEAVKTSLKAGYRHIDTAHAYGNHIEIGEALKECFDEGIVKRSDVFVTSKIWSTFHSFDLATQSIDVFLKELQLDYLDLVLIHWPFGYREGGTMFPKCDDGYNMHASDVDYIETWKAMQAAVKAGKVRSIGISNFNAQQVQRIIDVGGDVPCVMCQVELHPYFPQTELVEFCRKNNILVTGYSPLANNGHMFRKEGQPNLLVEPVLLKIAKAHGKSTAQVVIRWFLQKGLIVIPKSVTATRIVENFEVFDFELSAEDVKEVDSLSAVNWRILHLERDNKHPHYPFN
jgi:aldehyde reductase